jgi:hypothetical protein
MTDQPYPWRTNANIRDVLAAVRPTFVSLAVVEPIGGCSEEEIAKAERRLGRSLPQPVREFYQAMRPTEVLGGEPKEFGFYPLGSTELAWRSMEGAEPAADWISSRGLALGQSTYGDPFWWVEGHRVISNGSIVLLDHEGGLGGDVMFVHFARNFAEFLAKVAYFRDLYPPPGDALFQQEYAELNPSAKV